MPPRKTRRLSAEDRREAILQAATSLFLDQGYGAISIDRIVERIGGSKRDIYAHFGNRDGILGAIVTRISRTLTDTLDASGGAAGGAAGETPADLRDTLMRFGRQLTVMYSVQGFFSVYNTMVAEAPRFPDLAKTFYDQGPARTTARLARILDEARSRGIIHVDAPDTAAALFIGMLRSDLHFQILLGKRPVPDEREIDQIVTLAVDLFLNGIAHPRHQT